MEEVWKEITIPSSPNTPNIPHTIHHPTPTSHHFRGPSSFILQDFFNNNNNNNNVQEETFIINNNNNNSNNINPSIPEFQFFDNYNNNHYSKQKNYSNVSGLINNNAAAGGHDALASTSLLTTFGGAAGHGGACGGDGGAGGVALSNIRKRFSESGGGGEDEVESFERRHKRMIKNRESAARSRARKQAYITELELEVDHLSKENAKLRKQHLQLIETPPSNQHPRKYGIHRSSTAPL